LPEAAACRPIAANQGYTALPATCRPAADNARQIGRYRVEISWIDEHEHGSDATKAVWEIEVVESDPDGDGEGKVPLLHVALHAPMPCASRRGSFVSMRL
jgi:hypothetical protein